MVEEITKTQTFPPKPVPAPTLKTAPASKNIKLVLTGAGSFSGLGLKHIIKGQEVTVDSAKAEKLIAMGLFKKA